MPGTILGASCSFCIAAPLLAKKLALTSPLAQGEGVVGPRPPIGTISSRDRLGGLLQTLVHMPMGQ